MKRSGWDGATIERRTFSIGIKDSAANDDRGATAPPTPSSDARAFERHRHAEDGGTTVLTASLSATAAPVATSTVATAAQTKPKATLTIPFFKLNTLLN